MHQTRSSNRGCRAEQVQKTAGFVIYTNSSGNDKIINKLTEI